MNTSATRTGAAPHSFQTQDLGRLDYAAAWQLQREMAAARGADQIPDTLLWVEHPHTYTLGSAGDERNILLDADQLAARGVTVHRVDRGGDVTYHGPGQIVGYPLIKLPASGEGLHADVVGYVRALEEVLIRALAHFDIAAGRLPGLTGAWVGLEGTGHPRGPAKIAAIGVRVTTRRVTMHGFALNVDPDLAYFRGIIPCGIPDKPVTSMAEWTGHAFARADVIAALEGAFGDVFGK
ncbi:MAG: lipoyl(octanoyl) transferase LipB [Anaerolineae bacterium]|nr:lipoyl(octanoyl) transferase LipB [Anaerolineae bacterium]